ncbi:MAG: hypothetical protein OEZ01_13410, partial [Candidatus Heimdallarchaeota archaeon]|nr:hypothetical protein [Candidatus Heimdallarchaeota archaeon]
MRFIQFLSVGLLFQLIACSGKGSSDASPYTQLGDISVSGNSCDSKVHLWWNDYSDNGIKNISVHWNTTGNVSINDNFIKAKNNTFIEHADLQNNVTYYYKLFGDNGSTSSSAFAITGEYKFTPSAPWKWIAPNIPVTSLSKVIFENGKYYAVGEKGTIITSIDGISWSVSQGLCSVQDMNSITSTNEKFIAVGNKGTILSSSNGDVWSTQYYDPDITLKDVVWTGKEFVAVGSVIMVSQDGVKWSV